MSVSITNFLTSDSRIIILSILVSITTLVAIILIVFENKTKSREKQKKESDIIKLRKKEIESSMDASKTPQEKLEVINQNAKKLFNEIFNIDEQKGYSYLINFFKDRNLMRHMSFSQDMFSLYYSVDTITNTSVEKISRELIWLIESSKEDLIKIEKQKKIEQQKIRNRKELILTPNETYPKGGKIEIPKNVEKESSPGYLSEEQLKLIKAIELKKKELEAQSRKNITILRETEARLKQQRQLEEIFNKELIAQKNKTQQIEEKLSKSNIVEKKNIIKPEASCNIDKVWYHNIDVKPILGSDYVKQLKDRKREIHE